jgi:hypothetical protein
MAVGPAVARCVGITVGDNVGTTSLVGTAVGANESSNSPNFCPFARRTAFACFKTCLMSPKPNKLSDKVAAADGDAVGRVDGVYVGNTVGIGEGAFVVPSSASSE